MDDLQKQVEALKLLYLAMPTINYGPAQFNDEWNPNSQYYFDLYKQQTTHSVTYNGGYYILTDVPNGLPPDTDHAWRLVATTGSSTLGNFKGFYDAANNTPPLANGIGQSGDYYIVKVPGDATPSGEYADANDTIACNDLLMWEVGPAVSNTDSIIVSNSYSVLDNTDVQKGQTVTTALGALQGRINAILVTQAQQTTQITTLEQDVNALDALILTKQDLIPSAVNNNLAKFVNGQVQDSGIAASAVTTQGNNINVAGGLVKTDGNNAIVSAINISNAFTLVNANYQGTLASVLSQIIGTIPSPYTLPTASPTVLGGVKPQLSGALTINANGELNVAVNGKTIVIDANNQLAAVLPPPYTLPAATPTTLGGSIYPESGALVVDELGQVRVNVDGTSIKIINNQLVAAGDGTGTVTNVSSSNTDIGVATPTTTPVLTLNSTIDGAASKIVKLNELGQLGAIDIGTNGLVISPKTGTKKTLNQALADAYTSIPDIVISNTVFVGKNGTVTGSGAINNLYSSIQQAIDASPANTQIFVYASGLGSTTAYNENITLKASQVITGASSQFVVIGGTVTTPAAGGTCYMENLRIQPASNLGNISAVNIVGGANVTNLQLTNVDINLYGGTGSCVNWTNTNANSRLINEGTCAWNVISSANGAKLFTSGAGTAGQVILQNVSAQINDNINNVAYSIGGAVRFYHTLDNVYGQIVVSNTAQFIGTFLTIYTGNVAAMITNSTSISSLNSILLTTTANATAGTALVEGNGGFAYFNVSPANTTTKGFATTLNSGLGAIPASTYAMRLDSSGIAPFTAGLSDGLIQYDGSYFYLDTSTARYKIPYADPATNKLIASWLNYNQTPTFTNKTATDVISSAGFWAAVAQIAGTNLTYNATTGKLDASGGGGGTKLAAQYSNFAANTVIATGKINVSTATAKDIDSGLTPATTAEIPLLPNTNWNVMALINYRCANQPVTNATNLSYSGTVDNPPAYALSTANCGAVNGTIAAGIFTSTAGVNNYGDLTTNAYNNTYSITGYTVTVRFNPVPYIVGGLSSASDKVYMYSQLGNNLPAGLLIKNNNAVSAVSAIYASRSGGALGVNTTVFNQPATGATANSTVAMGIDNLAMAWDGSASVSRVAYSNNAMTANTPTWNQSTVLPTPITQTTWQLQAIGNGKGLIIDQTNGVTAVLDFATGNFTNGGNFPITNGQPVGLNYGRSDVSAMFIANLTTTQATPYVIYTIDNGANWVIFDLSSRGITGNVNGIAYNPVTNRWVCSTWDGIVNKFYYSSSATDPFQAMTWTQASGTANQPLTRIVGGYLAGGGYGFAIGCISVNSNVYTTVNDTSWAIPSSIPNYSASILPYYAGGMLVCAPNFSSNPFIHTSIDGINFAKINVQKNPYRCGSVGGNLIIPASDGAIAVSLAYAYVFNATNLGSVLPQAAWSGNQQILAGVSNTSSVNRLVMTIANYSHQANTSNSLTMVSNTVNNAVSGNMWFASTLLGFSGGETVTSVSAQLNTLGNTFTANLVGTNATLSASMPQTATKIGDDFILLIGKCRAGTTTPSVAVQITYADGTNSILPNSTITAYQL